MKSMLQKTYLVTAVDPGFRSSGLGLPRAIHTPPTQPRSTITSKARTGSDHLTRIKSCARQFQVADREAFHPLPSRSRSSKRAVAPTRAVVAPFGDLAEGVADLGAAPIIGLAVLGVSALVYRAVIYSKVQYITASLLGNRTPRGGARVLEIGVAGGKNLYYYPKDVAEVVGVDPASNEELLMRSAAAAGVYMDYRKGHAEQLDLASNSMDCAVSTITLSTIPLATRALAIKEISRVLKPGAPFLYVEELKGDGSQTLELIKGNAEFTGVEYDQGWANGMEPHAIGVAVKRGMTSGARAAGAAAEDAADELEDKLRGTGRRGKKQKGGRQSQRAKGF